MLHLVVMLNFLERLPPLCMLLLVLKQARYYSLTDIHVRSQTMDLVFKLFVSFQVDAPLPHVNIYIDLIHKAMHGSDTGAYDAKGR